MKKILLIMIFLLSFSLANACILPDNVELVHEMDLEMLKATNTNHEILNEVVLIEYDDFVLTVEESRATITCREVLTDCFDDSDFRSVLDDLENWNAYDLSKEDKDTISSLYQPKVIIKKLESKDLFLLKFKNLIKKIIGMVFCTNYEEVIECDGEWCSLEELNTASCPVALTYCG